MDHNEQQLITLPDFDNSEGLSAFMTMLQRQTHRHGVRRLLEAIEKYLYHKKLQADWLEKIAVAVQVVNGIRTPLQVVGDKERVWTRTAYNFFSSLNDKQLEKQAEFYEVEVKEREGLIRDLVEIYVEDKKSAVLDQIDMFERGQ